MSKKITSVDDNLHKIEALEIAMRGWFNSSNSKMKTKQIREIDAKLQKLKNPDPNIP